MKAEGNSFVLDYGDANMRGTFIAPAKVILSHRTGDGAVMATSSKIAATFERNQIVASGEAGTEGLFIMVATFQRGAPPEVKAEGEGLATVVRVGDQTVWRDRTRPANERRGETMRKLLVCNYFISVPRFA